MIKSPTPSSSTRSTQPHGDSRSRHFRSVTLCGWTLVTSKQCGLQRSWTTASWDHFRLWKGCHLMLFDLVCPWLYLTSTRCSMFLYCNLLAPVISLIGWLTLYC